MKKLALAVALMGFMGSASATGLRFDSSQYTNPNIMFSAYDSTILTGAVNSGSFGQLFADVAGTITFTYIGQESGFVNRFALVIDGPNNNLRLEESGIPGVTNVSSFINAGLVNFRFVDTSTNPNTVFNNGQISQPTLGFALLNVSGALPGEFYFGFNDTFKGDADYDDIVVKATFSAVPVPAALPLMATALGLFGFGASRRRV